MKLPDMEGDVLGKKIDVIIPMYNRAEYIDDLLKTLEAQTFRDFRVIFVDDGSTDDTQKVLGEKLATVSFPYISLYQENKGAGGARNTGLKASDSEWSVFIDSDDTLLPQYLEYLYNAASGVGADFAYCDFREVAHGTDFEVPAPGELKTEVITAAECMKRHYTNWLSNACIIINGDFRRKNEIYYDENCTYTEDNNFVTDLISAADKIVRVDNVLYLYHIYQGSRSRSPSSEKFISGVESFQRLEKKLENVDTEAAAVFRSVAPERYYLATCRKAAVQLSLKEFKKLANRLPLKKYGSQFSNMVFKQKIAGKILLFSKTGFYIVMHLLFKD